MIHLEGMGVLGALTALRLADADIEFTWHDPESPHVAWKACTGMIYPAGDDWSTRNLTLWARWAEQGWLPAGVLAPACYVYAHKNPPHEGRYRTAAVGSLTMADTPAYTLNAPALVHAARSRFAQRRRDAAPPNARLVVAHGYRRANSFMWGWSAKVQLHLSPALAALPHPPALYGRKVRQLTYAYPVPGEPGRWWAGSSLVRQTATVRALDAAKHFRRWRRDLHEVYRGEVAVAAQTGPVLQGWRPRPVRDDRAPVPTAEPDGTIVYPALWHSGVRWAPLAVDHALTLL